MSERNLKEIIKEQRNKEIINKLDQINSNIQTILGELKDLSDNRTSRMIDHSIHKFKKSY